MKTGFGVDMFEVTRLTREGRLQEAMEMLSGRSAAQDKAEPQERSGAASEADVTTIDLVSPGGNGRGAWTLPGFGVSGDGAKAAAAGAMPQMPRFVSRLTNLGHGDVPKAGGAGRAPSGAAFEERSFANGHGTCTYKLYTPSTFAGQALPLVVMLHGCTQTPDDFALGTHMNEVAEEFGFFVAYPAQSQSANPSRCWNWFAGDHQVRGQGEPSLIAGVARQIMQDVPVDPARVFIAGLSAGGAAAATLGELYPDLFAAIGVHSGLACGAATDMASAFGAMRNGAAAAPRRNASPASASARIVPTIVFHGDQDTTVNAINGDQIMAQARAKAELRTKVSDGETSGIRYTRTTAEDASGELLLEHWRLHGGVHAWSGGSPGGTFTTAGGPDASREMARFFLTRRAD